MNTYIVSFTKAGAALAERVSKLFESVHSFAKYPIGNQELLDKDIRSLIGDIFNVADVIIFVGASGIAVRAIAPFLSSKADDPAVIVIDDTAKYVIPILSGHIGGANRIADIIAYELCAQAVITTATDNHEKFAVDTWAMANNRHILDIDKIKDISSALLRGDNVGFYSDYDIDGALPEGLIKDTTLHTGIAILSDSRTMPFKNTLRIVPKVYSLGIGCRKGSSCAGVKEFAERVLREANIDKASLNTIASVTFKKDENAIIELASSWQLPFIVYTPEELAAVDGVFSSSDFVLSSIGVDNVCERAAVKSSSGELVVRKTISDGVTIACAHYDWVCRF